MPAVAQSIQMPVWALPAGRAVCGDGVAAMEQVVTEGTETFTIQTRTEARVCWDAFAVEDGHVVGADETLTRWEAEQCIDGTTVCNTDPNPMLGRALRLSRGSGAGARWTARVRDAAPTNTDAEYLRTSYDFELIAFYAPDGAVEVGTSWDVPDSVLDVYFGPLGPDATYRIRLDSATATTVYLTHKASYTTTAASQPTVTRLVRTSEIDRRTGVELRADLTTETRATWVRTEGKPVRTTVTGTMRLSAVRRIVAALGSG